MPDVDLQVSHTTGDCVWDDDTLACVAGADLVTQRLVLGLKTFSEEPLLVVIDPDGGTAYWTTVFTDRPRTHLVEALFRKRILDDEDVERLDLFTMTVDRRSRKVTVEFRAISKYGPIAASVVLP